MIKFFFFFQGKNAMSNATNKKHGCIWMRHSWSITNFTQDMGLNQFRFLTWSMTSLSLEVTRTWTVLDVFGSRWSSDVTWSIFCPNFCKMATSIFQLDLMNLFVKAWAWFNPITQGISILIAHTSSTIHRDERLGNTHAMHGKCNYEIEMPEETSFLS